MKVGTKLLGNVANTSYSDLESPRHNKILLLLCKELGIQTKEKGVSKVPAKVRHLFGRIPTNHLVSGMVKMAYQRGLSRRQICLKFSLTIDETRRIIDRVRDADRALMKENKAKNNEGL